MRVLSISSFKILRNYSPGNDHRRPLMLSFYRWWFWYVTLPRFHDQALRNSRLGCFVFFLPFLITSFVCFTVSAFGFLPWIFLSLARKGKLFRRSSPRLKWSSVLIFFNVIPLSTVLKKGVSASCFQRILISYYFSFTFFPVQLGIIKNIDSEWWIRWKHGLAEWGAKTGIRFLTDCT